MTSEVLSTETKFTSGPWAPHLDSGSPPFVTRKNENSGWICQTVTWCGLDEAKANAALIAAAPCLFEALDRLLNCVDGVHDYDQLHRCKRNALAALNRARGGSSNEGE